MIIYHLQKEKLPPVFEPFWNSFHFSIKCALLPTRGWTIKKVLNTATPWGGSFYLKISLICPYWFYALAFLSVFSFFCRRSGGDASSDTRPLAPPRPPYVWLRTKTNHQVNTPQRSWNFRLTRIVPDHVSKSSFFWVYFIISHQSKLFPLKRIWDVQISLTLLNKNNFNGDHMLVCQKLIQIGRFIHLVLKIFINLPRLEIPRQFIPDYVRDTILESGVECYINSAATKVALFAYITCQSALHIFTGWGAFCKSFTLPWELIWRPTQRFLSASMLISLFSPWYNVSTDVQRINNAKLSTMFNPGQKLTSAAVFQTFLARSQPGWRISRSARCSEENVPTWCCKHSSVGCFPLFPLLLPFLKFLRRIFNFDVPHIPG